jgi:3-oxoacyl-[acyl-carrier-protein] synthase II
MKNRVVITGMGMVTAAGIGVEENWENMIRGKSCVDFLQSESVKDMMIDIGAEVRALEEAKSYVPKKIRKLINKNVEFAIVAAGMAMDDSGLLPGYVDEMRLGVYMGSGEVGGPDLTDYYHAIKNAVSHDGSFDMKKFGVDGIRQMDPFFLLRTLPNNGICYISMILKAKGINNNFVMSAVAGSQAIGEAYRAIQRGDADVIVAGGYDSLLNLKSMFDYDLQGVLSKDFKHPSKAIKPFDVDRDGFALGEGAAIVILESLQHAKERGAPIRGEIAGYGRSCGGHAFRDPTSVECAFTVAMRSAVKDASISVENIDYINANGDATLNHDRIEVNAIRSAFRSKAEQIPVSSVKPIVGYTGAASGAIDAIAALLALERKIIPPTINLTKPDVSCDLWHVSKSAIAKEMEHVMTVNVGFGGQTTAIVLKGYL